MAPTGFDQAVEQYHQGLRELLKGNPEPQKQMYSRREDVSLLNPMGLTMRGWAEIAQTVENVAAQFRDGDISFENIVTYVTPELGFIVEVEHTKGKLGSMEDIAEISLRVTTIFRPEGDGWKVVHRHADATTSVQPIESLAKGAALRSGSAPSSAG